MTEEQKKSQKGTNLATELARERSCEAAERTLLAWVRTCLSLIAFGFAIYRFRNLVQDMYLDKSADTAAAILGLCFMLLGVLAMIAATIEHSKVLKQIKSDDFLYTRSGLGMVVSVALALVGMLAFITVLLELFVFKLPK